MKNSLDHTRVGLLLLAITFGGALGCGTSQVYRPSQASRFELDPASEINDDDVKKAFAAQPQLGKSLRVALFSFESKRQTELEGAVQQLPGVVSTYVIPALLVTGQRRFETENRGFGAPARGEVSIKKLRLLAARARCDVLLVVDYGNRVRSSPNALAMLNVLLLPTFFVPYLDVKVESYLEGFLIDTRNGYLYGQLLAQQDGSVRYQPLYSTIERAMLESQWRKLLGDFSLEVRRILTTPPPPAALAPVSPGIAVPTPR